MDAKTSCSKTNKDDHDDHQDSSGKPEVDPSVEKQNLVPKKKKKKKIIMKNHDGVVLHKQYYDEPESSQDSSEEPEPSLSVKKLDPVPKKKKLLVMSLNGFLIHRVYVYDKEALPKSRTDQYESLNFLLFKRPFSEEFMKFCLERFEVGIWSSAQKHNIDGALDLAIGEESKNKLLFVWDQSECTISYIKSKENNKKPIYFKPIESVWGEVKKGGPYSEFNTLMIGDKPYKASINPRNTAIFVKSYDPDDKEDNALDPNGELCEYLRGVAEAEDVQSYVENNAFGIPAISTYDNDPESTFYFNAHFNFKESIFWDRKIDSMHRGMF